MGYRSVSWDGKGPIVLLLPGVMQQALARADEILWSSGDNT